MQENIGINARGFDKLKTIHEIIERNLIQNESNLLDLQAIAFRDEMVEVLRGMVEYFAKSFREQVPQVYRDEFMETTKLFKHGIMKHHKFNLKTIANISFIENTLLQDLRDDKVRYQNQLEILRSQYHRLLNNSQYLYF